MVKVVDNLLSPEEFKKLKVPVSLILGTRDRKDQEDIGKKLV